MDTTRDGCPSYLRNFVVRVMAAAVASIAVNAAIYYCPVVKGHVTHIEVTIRIEKHHAG
jgi:hypothetical protein